MQSQFEREELQAPLSEINMTPLVDVMLVLMVIFLVTAPIINSAIELNLPSSSASKISNDEAFIINIDSKGNYYIKDKKIALSNLKDQLKILAKNSPKKQIHLRADIDVTYGKVSDILILAQKLGLTNIGFVTKPEI